MKMSEHLIRAQIITTWLSDIKSKQLTTKELRMVKSIEMSLNMGEDSECESERNVYWRVILASGKTFECFPEITGVPSNTWYCNECGDSFDPETECVTSSGELTSGSSIMYKEEQNSLGTCVKCSGKTNHFLCIYCNHYYRCADKFPEDFRKNIQCLCGVYVCDSQSCFEKHHEECDLS